MLIIQPDSVSGEIGVISWKSFRDSYFFFASNVLILYLENMDFMIVTAAVFLPNQSTFINIWENQKKSNYSPSMQSGICLGRTNTNTDKFFFTCEVQRTSEFQGNLWKQCLQLIMLHGDGLLNRSQIEKEVSHCNLFSQLFILVPEHIFW